MEFTVSRRVVFSETDASGRVHFAQILKWVEEAEHQCLREAGVLVFAGTTGWPRVRVECDYRSPLAFEQEVEIALTLSKIGGRSLSWAFQIKDSGGETAAEGILVTAYVEGGKAVEMPAQIRELLSREKPSR